MEDFTDDEDDRDRGYKISPIDDEESHIYAKIGAPASFMMHRFQQQPFPSNPSISRYVILDSYWSTLVILASDWSTLVIMASDWSRLVIMASDWSWY